MVVNADCSCLPGRNDLVGVIGGCIDCKATNSVILLNVGEQNKKWIKGPPLNEERSGHAAVVGNGSVYVLGGSGSDTIERIRVVDLLGTKKDDNIGWKLLKKCRLSTKRHDCAAAMVQNRFIVVVGGHEASSSVDVIDMSSTHCHRVCSGSSLNVPRSFCTAASIGSRVYVVGGYDGTTALNSIEHLNLDTKNEAKDNLEGLSWTLDEGVVESRRYGHGMVQCGSCLVLAYGCAHFHRGSFCASDSVEVFDTLSYQKWNLKPCTETLGKVNGMVAFRDGIAVLGGQFGMFLDECQTLDWMDNKSRVFSQLMRSDPPMLGTKTQTKTCGTCGSS